MESPEKSFFPCFFQNITNHCLPWLRNPQLERVDSLNPAAGSKTNLPRDHTPQTCGLR
jgi:hypothetical protein